MSRISQMADKLLFSIYFMLQSSTSFTFISDALPLDLNLNLPFFTNKVWNLSINYLGIQIKASKGD